MNLRIRRRRFGQLAIVSAATAAIANLASKSVAQQQDIIYGVRLTGGKIISAIPGVLENTTGINLGSILPSILTTVVDELDIVRSTPEFALIAFNLATGQELSVTEVAAAVIENVDSILGSLISNVFTQDGERLTGLTSLLDGTFVVASVGRTRRGNVSRLIFTNPRSNQPRRALGISGLPNPISTLESLLPFRDNQLLSIISLNQGIPPFDLATIDLQTGRVTSGNQLALPNLQTGARFSNLTQSPDGAIYATTIGRESATSLVQLDLENRAIITGRGRINRLVQLSLNNQPVENDVLSLVFSPSGQLFALANPTYEETNSLFSVDVRTGQMRLVSKFNARKITFARS